jgi:hypothetical protein
VALPPLSLVAYRTVAAPAELLRVTVKVMAPSLSDFA